MRQFPMSCWCPVRWLALLGVVLTLGGAQSAGAQWMTQSLTLRPGWNAVYLQVDPEPSQSDLFFWGRPVETILEWDRAVQVGNPADIFDKFSSRDLPPQEELDELARMPTRRALELRGCRAYLIKVSTNAPVFTMSVKGRIRLPDMMWRSRSLNLVGLLVHSNHPPTFTEYFRFTPYINTAGGLLSELYRIDLQGRGRRILRPNYERVEPGVAYWIRCIQAPEYMAPLHIQIRGGEAFDFGYYIQDKEFLVKNTDPSRPLAVMLRVQPSESSSSVRFEYLGPVPLAYLDQSPESHTGWALWPTNGLTKILPPHGEWPMIMRVRREDMAPYRQVQGRTRVYAGILEVADTNESVCLRVPILAMRP